MERLQFDDQYTQTIYDTLKDDPTFLYVDEIPDNMVAYNNKMRIIHSILMQESNIYLREAIKQQNEVSKLLDENVKLYREYNELARKYNLALDDVVQNRLLNNINIMDKISNAFKNIYKNIRYRLGCKNNTKESK